MIIGLNIKAVNLYDSGIFTYHDVLASNSMEESIFDVNVTVRNRGYAEGEFDILIEEGGGVAASKKVQAGKSHADF